MVNPPVWTDNVLIGQFQIGQPFTEQVTATNFPTYTISAGALPYGITLASNTGAISGTVLKNEGYDYEHETNSYPYSFTIRASNSSGFVEANYAGTVYGPKPYPPKWSDQALGTFYLGTAYSDSVHAIPTAADGEEDNDEEDHLGGGSHDSTINPGTTGPGGANNGSGVNTGSGVWISSIEYTIHTGSLPHGISLNSSTGAVTGTPDTGGAYSFTIKATNVYGAVYASFSGLLGGQPQVYNGTAWEYKSIATKETSGWVNAVVYVYDGSNWMAAL